MNGVHVSSTVVAPENSRLLQSIGWVPGVGRECRGARPVSGRSHRVRRRGYLGARHQHHCFADPTKVSHVWQLRGRGSAQGLEELLPRERNTFVLSLGAEVGDLVEEAVALASSRPRDERNHERVSRGSSLFLISRFRCLRS